MNRITATLLCLMLCLAGTTVPNDAKVFAADIVANRVIVMTIGSKILKVNDVDGEIDAGPQIKWGRTFSPIAPIINALGGTTQWDAKTRRVTIDLDTKTIVLTISSRYAVVNGKSVSIDSNPDLVPYVQAPGRTMLPVRFIAEQFGALVTWNSTLQRVTLALKVTSPPLLTRPFPAPVTTRTVTVPGSIDATGKTDVSAALNAFLATVANGSIISFPTGATYKLHKSIHLADRHNLIFEGNGTTLHVDATAAANSAYRSPFQVGDDPAHPNTDIVIHDFILVGNSSTPGIYVPDSESQANLQIYATTRIEIYDITGSAAPGDFIHLEQVNGAWIHDCHALTAGRQGVSVISGSGILVEDCAFDVSGFITFDVEPNGVNDACSDITFRNCTAGTYGYLFSAVYDMAEAAIDQITVDNNTVTGGSLKTLVTNGGTVRMTRITFTNNKGTAAAGPLLYFGHVDGLTVTGNVQPLRSGVFTSITDCTGAR